MGFSEKAVASVKTGTYLLIRYTESGNSPDTF